MMKYEQQLRASISKTPWREKETLVKKAGKVHADGNRDVPVNGSCCAHPGWEVVEDNGVNDYRVSRILR